MMRYRHCSGDEVTPTPNARLKNATVPRPAAGTDAPATIRSFARQGASGDTTDIAASPTGAHERQSND
jgi:hypothetical protein